MKEIELKFLDIDVEQVKEKLLELGAKKVFDGIVQTVLFDFSDERLKNRNDLLRLRQMDDVSSLTAKLFVEHKSLKVREELEVRIDDFDVMKKILFFLGLEESLVIVKHRISFVLDDARFEFDKHLKNHAFIPEFLEIEAKDESAMNKYVDLLALTLDNGHPWGFFEVFQHYKTI